MTLVDTAAPLAIADAARPRRSSLARPVVVRTLSRRDLHEALASGWADFRAAPTQNIFLCALYPLVALLLARAASGGTLLPLLYPAASGFALVGPLAAVGLFEISGRRERGEPVRATDAFRVLRRPGFGPVAVLGLGLLLLFVVWMAVSEALLGATLSTVSPVDPAAFVDTMVETSGGVLLILLGNLAGFLFALVGLAVALPVLGHATWHLYRRAIAPEI